MVTQHIKAIFFRHFWPIPRDISRFTEMIYWPLFDITVFGLLGLWVQEQTNAAFAIRLIAGLILWQGLVRAHVEVAYSLIEEIWANNLTTIFSTPLRLTEWFVGVFAVSFIKTVFVFLFAICMAWLMYDVNLISLGWHLISFFIALVFCGWWLSFITLSVILRFGRRAESLVWVMGWALTPLCGVYYPTRMLPAWAQKISLIFPQTYLFKNLDMIIITNHADSGLWLTTIGLIVLFFALGCLCMHSAFTYSKKLGFTNLAGD